MNPNNLFPAPPHDDSISLLDILDFLKRSYAVIFICLFLGLIVSSAYLFFAPTKYEAVAQIQMAQVSRNVINSNASNSDYNIQGVNIEEPALLISRLALPTSFSAEVKHSCSLDDSVRSGELLARSIKLTLVKGVPNVVELRVTMATPNAATSCAAGIYDLIASTQAALIAPYLQEVKAKLEEDEGRLIKAQNIVAKSDQSGQAISATYLSTRDEIRYLLDEMAAMKNIISFNQGRHTRLISPIYTNNVPVSPKKRLTLFIGGLSGLLCGVLVALWRGLALKRLS